MTSLSIIYRRTRNWKPVADKLTAEFNSKPRFKRYGRDGTEREIYLKSGYMSVEPCDPGHHGIHLRLLRGWRVHPESQR